MSDTHLYIAFRGSSSFFDWKSNLGVRKTFFYGIQAHRGFAAAAKRMLPVVIKIVEENLDKEIVITGHSRGGAISALIAYALYIHYRSKGIAKKFHCITFGQPRFASRGQSNMAIHGDFIRVINGGDVVTRVPRFGYGHGGKNAYINRKRKLILESSFIYRFFDRIPQLFRRGYKHTMGRYWRDLKLAYLDYKNQQKKNG